MIPAALEKGAAVKLEELEGYLRTLATPGKNDAPIIIRGHRGGKGSDVNMEELEEHIRTLAALEESDAHVISCYLNVGRGRFGFRWMLDERVQLLRKSLSVHALGQFEEALGKIEAFLSDGFSIRTRGIAVFARAGRQPFFLALRFDVPSPNWIAVGSTPNIYHLMELTNNYERYAILLVTETSARIIGVNLGALKESVWKTQRRVGTEWAKEHSQDHRRERTNQFIYDQVRSLERLLSEGGYGHLILAGNARIIAAVRRALPKRLTARLADVAPASTSDRVSDVITSTLQSFVEHEEVESHAIVEELITQIHTQGLAVAGTRATMQAFQAGQPDYLVVGRDYDPGLGWECHRCGRVETESPQPDACPECRNRHLRQFETRGELVRLAGQVGCGVEVVEHSDALVNLGGVGCLLRFLAPETRVSKAA
jgi:rubrerythrin